MTTRKRDSRVSVEGKCFGHRRFLFVLRSAEVESRVNCGIIAEGSGGVVCGVRGTANGGGVADPWTLGPSGPSRRPKGRGRTIWPLSPVSCIIRGRPFSNQHECIRASTWHQPRLLPSGTRPVLSRCGEQLRVARHRNQGAPPCRLSFLLAAHNLRIKSRMHDCRSPERTAQWCLTARVWSLGFG